MLSRMPLPVGGGGAFGSQYGVSVPARTVTETATDIGMLALCGLVWLVVIVTALVLLRAVVAENSQDDPD